MLHYLYELLLEVSKRPAEQHAYHSDVLSGQIRLLNFIVVAAFGTANTSGNTSHTLYRRALAYYTVTKVFQLIYAGKQGNLRIILEEFHRLIIYRCEMHFRDVLGSPCGVRSSHNPCACRLAVIIVAPFERTASTFYFLYACLSIITEEFVSSANRRGEHRTLYFCVIIYVMLKQGLTGVFRASGDIIREFIIIPLDG